MTIKFHIIGSNDGAEFKNYDTIAQYRENTINYIFILPYAPESYGLIENFNLTILYNVLKSDFKK